MYIAVVLDVVFIPAGSAPLLVQGQFLKFQFPQLGCNRKEGIQSITACLASSFSVSPPPPLRARVHTHTDCCLQQVGVHKMAERSVPKTASGRSTAPRRGHCAVLP